MVKVEYITNQFFNSRTYVLSEKTSDKIWLVDCGDVDNALKTFAIGKEVTGVLLTHTHADHLYGLNRLLEFFPDTKIFTNAFGAEALSDSRLNITKYHDEVPDFVISCKKNVCVVDEGVKIDLFEDTLADVFSTLGHDASCLTYKVENFLFTGDSYIPGIPVVAKFPKSDKKQAVLSEARIKILAKGMEVCPGHSL